MCTNQEHLLTWLWWKTYETVTGPEELVSHGLWPTPPKPALCSQQDDQVAGRQQKQPGFPGGSVVKNLPAKQLQSLGQEDALKKEMANPLQYSYLENSMDREACRGTVHGVAKELAGYWMHMHTRALWSQNESKPQSPRDGLPPYTEGGTNSITCWQWWKYFHNEIRPWKKLPPQTAAMTYSFPTVIFEVYSVSCLRQRGEGRKASPSFEIQLRDAACRGRLGIKRPEKDGWRQNSSTEWSQWCWQKKVLSISVQNISSL